MPGAGLREEPLFLRYENIIIEDCWKICLWGWFSNSAGGFGPSALMDGIPIGWLVRVEGPLERQCRANNVAHVVLCGQSPLTTHWTPQAQARRRVLSGKSKVRGTPRFVSSL